MHRNYTDLDATSLDEFKIPNILSFILPSNFLTETIIKGKETSSLSPIPSISRAAKLQEDDLLLPLTLEKQRKQATAKISNAISTGDADEPILLEPLKNSRPTTLMANWPSEGALLIAICSPRGKEKECLIGYRCHNEQEVKAVVGLQDSRRLSQISWYYTYNLSGLIEYLDEEYLRSIDLDSSDSEQEVVPSSPVKSTAVRPQTYSTSNFTFSGDWNISMFAAAPTAPTTGSASQQDNFAFCQTNVSGNHAQPKNIKLDDDENRPLLDEVRTFADVEAQENETTAEHEGKSSCCACQ